MRKECCLILFGRAIAQRVPFPLSSHLCLDQLFHHSQHFVAGTNIQTNEEVGIKLVSLCQSKRVSGFEALFAIHPVHLS